jgi:CBS domain containing-hemolysin-like protein
VRHRSIGACAAVTKCPSLSPGIVAPFDPRTSTALYDAPSRPIRFVAGVGLLPAKGFFVAIEVALTRVRQYSEGEFDRPGLRRGWAMTDDLESYLKSCRVGITASSIAVGIEAKPTLSALFEPIVARHAPGGGRPAGGAPPGGHRRARRRAVPVESVMIDRDDVVFLSTAVARGEPRAHGRDPHRRYPLDGDVPEALDGIVYARGVSRTASSGSSTGLPSPTSGNQ